MIDTGLGVATGAVPSFSTARCDEFSWSTPFMMDFALGKLGTNRASGAVPVAAVAAGSTSSTSVSKESEVCSVPALVINGAVAETDKEEA